MAQRQCLQRGSGCSIAFDKAMGLIPALTADECAKLITFMRAQGKVKSPPAQSKVEQVKPEEPKSDRAAPHEDWLFLGICRVLQERGLLTQSASKSLWFRLPPNFVKNSEEIRKYLLGFTGHLHFNDLLNLGYVVALALIHWCESWMDSIEPTRMLGLVSRIPEAIEHAYPGYLESGMFIFLLPRRRQKVA